MIQLYPRKTGKWQLSLKFLKDRWIKGETTLMISYPYEKFI